MLFRRSTSTFISIQVHHKSSSSAITQEVIAKANTDIVTYSTHASFDAEQVIVVTWVDMQPAPCDSYAAVNDTQLVSKISL